MFDRYLVLSLETFSDVTGHWTHFLKSHIMGPFKLDVVGTLSSFFLLFVPKTSIYFQFFKICLF